MAKEKTENKTEAKIYVTEKHLGFFVPDYDKDGTKERLVFEPNKAFLKKKNGDAVGCVFVVDEETPSDVIKHLEVMLSKQQCETKESFAARINKEIDAQIKELEGLKVA